MITCFKEITCSFRDLAEPGRIGQNWAESGRIGQNRVRTGQNSAEPGRNFSGAGQKRRIAKEKFAHASISYGRHAISATPEALAVFMLFQ